MLLGGALVVTAAVVGAAVVTSRGASAGDGASPLATARPFTLPAVNTTAPPVALSAAPGHPVVLTFFAAWCQPCTAELPLIERLTATAGAPSVVGIDELDQRADGLDLLRRTKVTFPAAFDHDGSVGRAWAVNGLPITVFIGADGRVVDYHRGELHQAQLDALVRRLVGARG